MRSASITAATAAGSTAGMPASASAGAPAGLIESANLGGLVRRIENGDAGGTGLLLVVGLLLGLILISAGCGPPS
jgi:hypothetical protein